jgi:ketosteroid isomerase-like protein
MLSWIGKKMIEHQLSRLRKGDIRASLRMDAPDVEMTFPGESSWGGVIRGKAEHRRWLERFVRVGIQIFADEVVLKGWPWKQTVCIRGRDHLSSGGETVYDNRYVIWGRLRWGRLQHYEVYEDTIKTQRFDEWLAEGEHTLAAA